MKEECEKCRYCFQVGVRKGEPALVCRRYPPQTHFIIVPKMSENQLMVKAQPVMVPIEEQRSAFPAVMKDWSCGEFAPKIELAS